MRAERIYNYRLISKGGEVLGYAVLEKGCFRFEPEIFPLQNFTSEALREIADNFDRLDNECK